MKRLSFNLEMARVFHDENKTRTWRMMKKQTAEGAYHHHDEDGRDAFANPCTFHRYPYLPGEIVFVAEPWNDSEDVRPRIEEPFIYAADNKWSVNRWRSPNTMPERASRAKVRILSCVPQRVQDVTEEEAIREGFAMTEIGITARTCFRIAINSIYPGAWEKNAFGWAVEFVRVRENK